MKETWRLPGLVYVIGAVLVWVVCFLLFLFVGDRAATAVDRYFRDRFSL